MRDFLVEELGATAAEFDELYRLRCRITHGRLGLDHPGSVAASAKTDRIEQLLLEAIKRALGWPADRPPRLRVEGYRFLAAAALDFMIVASESEQIDYDQPPFAPEESVFEG
jgi:hypothetical protein